MGEADSGTKPPPLASMRTSRAADMSTIATVVVDKVINGGVGLARLADGRIALVSKALPGEHVRLAIRQDKGQYLHAEIAAVEVGHPSRIDPPCPWYGACGGCNLQHASYALQLELKSAIITDLMQRQPDALDFGWKGRVPATLAAPFPFGYRQRIRLQIDDQSRPGFSGSRSHTIVPIRQCLVARDELNAALAVLRQSPAAGALFGHSLEIELMLNPVTTRVVCLFHLRRPPRPADIQKARDLAAATEVIERVFFCGEGFGIAGPFGLAELPEQQEGAMLHLQLPPMATGGRALTLGWEVGGFCQVNLEQNELLVRHVISLCDLRAGDTVLDLFCGMGNFSIPLAFSAGVVTGIEGQGSAVRSASRNSIKAGLKNTQFFKAPVHDACRRLADEGQSFDCVILDPPRQGAPGLSASLAAVTRRRMVYISCDPATLCRDLSALKQHGLHLVRIQPFDMFPQTHHVETVAVLEKN